MHEHLHSQYSAAEIKYESPQSQYSSSSSQEHNGSSSQSSSSPQEPIVPYTAGLLQPQSPHESVPQHSCSPFKGQYLLSSVREQPQLLEIV